MSLVILVVLLHHGSSLLRSQAPISTLWEEEAVVQKMTNGYHPMIRFGCWDIQRYNRSKTYMFVTPEMVQQGVFEIRDNHYSFKAIMAIEIENADKSKLTQNMSPGEARSFADAYTKSMYNFEGDYDKRTGKLSISYPVKGTLKTFSLYATNGGDDQLTGNGANTGVAGLWQEPDPFPERMDAHTRDKIDELGLEHFIKEAGASESAMFNILDLRNDFTFRLHGQTGSWSRDGSTVILRPGQGVVRFQLSQDGKLLSGGKPAYIR